MDSFGNKISQTAAYTDFNALAELRARATSASKSENERATKAVSKQFEALFIQMMLKSMRDATYIDKPEGGDQTRFYQDMFDKQIAMDLVNRENGGIGLAKIMQQQLLPGAQRPLQTPAVGTAPARRLTQTGRPWRPDSPQAFIRDVLPHAEKAAARLGVSPRVLVAQSALETGWGRKMMVHDDGRNAFNLFGIKADQRWQGESIQRDTLEFRDGVAEKQRARFRAYDSIAHSFDDYVRFIEQSPRYRQALAVAADDQAYLQRLQQAGYSTDPAYAEKIQGIIQRHLSGDTVVAMHEGDR